VAASRAPGCASSCRADRHGAKANLGLTGPFSAVFDRFRRFCATRKRWDEQAIEAKSFSLRSQSGKTVENDGKRRSTGAGWSEPIQTAASARQRAKAERGNRKKKKKKKKVVMRSIVHRRAFRTRIRAMDPRITGQIGLKFEVQCPISRFRRSGYPQAWFNRHASP
jgi:hypothetical protein